MTTDILRETLADGVATLTLNRPDRRNGLDRELGLRLLESVLRAVESPAVRAIVLTGEGRAFCAGDDISGLGELVSGRRENTPSVQETGDAYYLRICEALVQAPKPVIAGINGAAVGAGAEIACAADYRLATSSARIGSGLIKLGQLGNTVMMSRVVGPARATEIFLTGRLLDAAEAEHIGLFDRVVSADAFPRELTAFAEHMAHGPTKTIGLFKELRERTWSQPAEYGLRLQDLYHTRCCGGEVEDGLEGPRAYLEHRAPKFTGR
ncbi:enoyl-CoA hydratase/isomerase family protein [Streptomyces gobiensis]|uniref:enoyl-CoA hydratase/isomerase family protein n=1 Tax=Streptomyces gobiensis TaxID=2875706 RepID=UPI001E460455|nr:enoyl-CoA hydratase-related protein [Streptomyces gobiensis]UGY94144.1 enoyl-CoA hydratase/isomerase family protein [Streptomyces gobiensis]